MKETTAVTAFAEKASPTAPRDAESIKKSKTFSLPKKLSSLVAKKKMTAFTSEAARNTELTPPGVRKLARKVELTYKRSPKFRERNMLDIKTGMSRSMK